MNEQNLVNTNSGERQSYVPAKMKLIPIQSSKSILVDSIITGSDAVQDELQ